MSLFEQFATNRKAEVEGVEFTFDNITFFRLARMGKSNKRYQKMLETETKPHIHAIRNETLPPELDESITRKVFVATVILGWRGMVLPRVFETTDEVPFSPEAANRLFDVLPELYSALREQASKMSNFRTAEIEEDSKN